MGKRKHVETVSAPEPVVEEVKEVVPQASSSGFHVYNNKQRILVIASRGITARYRYLLEDFKKLMPHHKKDNKLDDKSDIQAVNEIAEMKSCNQVMYLETRKHQDLYMYLGKTPQGPSVKFQVVNIHTMEELKLTGNCMIGSRPLLNFDTGFERSPHLQLMKALLSDAFGTPKGHPKSKPFLDRVMSFYLLKNNICSLGGPTLYQNTSYTSPNDERAQQKRAKGNRYVDRVQQSTFRKEFLQANPKATDELSSKSIFRDDNEEEPETAADDE